MVRNDTLTAYREKAESFPVVSDCERFFAYLNDLAKMRGARSTPKGQPLLTLSEALEFTMADTNKEKALCLLAQIAGGGLAGLADVEMSQTMPLGLPVGAIGGIAAAGIGFALSSGKNAKIGTYLLDIGGGMLAFESGTAVVNRVLKAKVAAAQATPAPGAVQGVLPGRSPSAASFVSQTPSNERAVTQEILRNNIARARQHAAKR